MKMPESAGGKLVTWGLIGTLGVLGLAGCGPDTAAPSSGSTVAAKTEGPAAPPAGVDINKLKCHMVLERAGDKYNMHAEPEGSQIPSGTKLEYHFAYDAKGLGTPYKTPEGTTEAENIVSTPAEHDGQALWAGVGTLRLSGAGHLGIACATATIQH